MLKKIIIVVMFILLAVTVYLLYERYQEAGELDEQPEEAMKPYSSDLASIFPSEKEQEFVFEGLAEYAHSETIKEIEEEEEMLTLYIEGRFFDARGPEYEEGRVFNKKYFIDNDSVTEVIDNKDPLREDGFDNSLHSIVPNQVVLKLPLEVNNSWEQEFEYNGEAYTAITTIVGISTINSAIQYETKLVVEGIADYIDNIYVEERVYQEGKGLVSFANVFNRKFFEQEDDPDPRTFMFNYHLTIIDDELI